MGIHGLMKLLSEECPEAIKEHDMEFLTGRKVAIDASMALYQFLIAVRSGSEGQASMMLTNEAGEVTSHIQGMFNRTIKMMTTGVKPVYVFDGKPPQLKGGELAKRMARRAQAEASLEASKQADEVDDINKFSRRLVKVTRQHNDDCKELLRLMGIPVINAPCEAEAQCAELAKKGRVYAAATEDMDALTFRTPRLLRKLTFSGQKQPITEIQFEAVLNGLKITYEQFVDLCILCGCDYCSTIKGIGPKTALKLIRTHGNLDTVVKLLARDKKYKIPPDWLPQTKAEKEAQLLATSLEKENQEPDLKNEEDDDNDDDHVDEEEEEDILRDDDEDGDHDNLDNHHKKKKKEVKDGVDMGDEHLDVEDSKVQINPKKRKVIQDEDDEEVVKKVPSSHSSAAAVIIGPGSQEENQEIDSKLDAVQEQEKEGEGKLEGKEEGEGKLEGKEEGEGKLEGKEEGDDDNEIIEPLYLQARKLFLNADVLPGETVEIHFSEPDEEGLRTFLVERMQFNPDRVNNAIKKLKEAQPKQAQQRMDNFFKPVAASGDNSNAKKKKIEPAKSAAKGKAPGRGGAWAKRK